MDKEGNFRNSKPCQNCIDVMKKFRVHRVIYSNENGGFSCELVNGMRNSAIVTTGWRWRHGTN
jgi:hypothetical protein